MSRWTFSESVIIWVCDVGLVVGAIEIYSIPAAAAVLSKSPSNLGGDLKLTSGRKCSREFHQHSIDLAANRYRLLQHPSGSENRTSSRHDCCSSGISSRSRKSCGAVRQFRPAYGNPVYFVNTSTLFTKKGTHWCKGRNWCSLVIRRNIIDCHSAISCCEILVAELRNAFEGPVSSAEVENCGPVVGEIFGECASCAIRFVGDVMGGVHCCVESILVGLGWEI